MLKHLHVMVFKMYLARVTFSMKWPPKLCVSRKRNISLTEHALCPSQMNESQECKKVHRF